MIYAVEWRDNVRDLIERGTNATIPTCILDKHVVLWASSIILTSILGIAVEDVRVNKRTTKMHLIVHDCPPPAF